MSGRDRGRSSEDELGRLRTLLIALAMLIAALALAAPGLAQSGEQEEPAASQDRGYPDTTPAESKAIFERESEPAMRGLDQRAQPLAGENVLEYRGDHIALVAPTADYKPKKPQGEPAAGMFRAEKPAAPTNPGDQTPSLVLSDIPLRAQASSGAKRPLDLTLVQSQGGFKAANPLVDFAASTSPTSGVSIGQGAERVTVTAAAATQAAPEGSRVSDLGVFYPEVALDTDLFVSPAPGGAEVFAQLRSPQAPEQIKLALELPAGAELRATPEGAAEIVDGGGKQIGLVSAPSAIDADGRPVEVSMAVEGNSLVLAVSRQEEPVSYPVLVDPVIDTFDTWGAAQQLPWRRVPADSGLPDSNPRWYTKKRNPGEACWQPATCWQNGLYVYGKSGVFFPENSYAGFTYSPPRYVPYGPGPAPDPGFPGTSAWIHRVVFDPVQYRLNGDSANPSSSAPRLKLGIFEDKGTVVAPRGIGSPYGNSPINKDNSYYGELNGPLNAYNTGDGTISGDPNGGDRSGKQVWFQLATHVARTTQALHEAYLGGAEIRLLDGEAPSASADDPDNNNATVQTPWLKSTANRSITITGNDKASNLAYGGLGIKSLSAQIFKPDAQSASGVLTPLSQIDCDGSHAKPCQVQASRPITYPTSQLPNGISYGWGHAYDALDKNQGLFGIGAWYIKVDREAPTQPTVSGPLLSAADPGNEAVVQASDPGGTGRDPGSATDRAAWRSGVAKIELFIDGVAETPVDREPFTCTQALETCRPGESATLSAEGVSEGDYTCKFVVTDAAGNPSQPLIKPCYVDGAPPETTITSGPSGLTNDKNPSFAYTSSRSSSTFRCKLDGPSASSTTLPLGTETDCTPSPKGYGPLADGYYRFSVKAKRKGLEDETPATRDFRVDGTPPETTITSGPSGLTKDPNASFGFTSSESGSSFQCRLSKTAPTASTGAWGSCTSPQSYSGLSDGSYKFEVKAKDPAGNEDTSAPFREFELDTTPPVTTITSGPSGPTRSASPSFAFSSNETGSTFKCSLDGAAFTNCASPKAYGPLADGDHYFQVQATDRAGNLDPSPERRDFKVDTKAPETTITSGPSGLTNNPNPSFGFSSSEANSTFQCRLSKTAPTASTGAWGPCTSPKPYSALSDGSYKFEVKAKDPAGNEDATPAPREFRIDATPPETTITSGPQGQTAGNSPSFGFTANEADSSFECRMDGAPFSPCTSPKAYADLSEGAHVFEVRATDLAGNLDPTAARRDFTIDSPLEVERLRCLIEERDDESGCDEPTRWIADDPAAPNDTVQRTLAFVRDDDVGNQAEPNRGVAKISLTLPGKAPIVEAIERCEANACPDYAGKAFEYSTDALPEGTSEASVSAEDPRGRVSAPRRFKLRVDRTAPTYNVDDFEADPLKRPLKAPTSLYQQGRTPQEDGTGPGLSQGQTYELQINAADQKTSVDASGQQRRIDQAGVASVEVRVDGETKFRRAQSCDRGDCPLEATFRFDPDDYLANDPAQSEDTHRVEAIIRDGAGNETRRAFEVRVRDEPLPDSELQRLGLEQYFHYDSTETGLSGAHVNLATGNLVWHRVPMVNPGRGLSSFLNLTYNSFDYPAGGDRPPGEDNRFDGEYDEFGLGFSGSISGITRMNEPLGGVGDFKGTSALAPPEVTLTDPDGTHHTFKLNTEDSSGLPADPRTTPVDPGSVGLVYDSPPGVDLRLRTFSPAEINANDPLADGGLASDGVLPEQREKFWAITRPDGVTYFFDGLGFARSIVDRDGNEIRFVYEHVVPWTGASCDALAKPVPGGDTVASQGCEPRLVKVIDAAGNDPGATQALIDRRTIKIAYYAPGVEMHSIGKVASITDHAGRKLTFAYDNRGLLAKLGEPGGVAAATRSTQFAYADDPDLSAADGTHSDPSDWPQLVRVTDPRGGQTRIDYCENRYAADGPCDEAGDLDGERPKRRVQSITNRAGDTRTFSYAQSEAQQEDRTLPSQTTVTDGRGEPWLTELDPRDRPSKLTDPLGIKTELGWSQRNQVLRQVTAAGSSDAATTSFAYNDNGLLLSQTDPLGRSTYLSYCDHSGTHRADDLAAGPVTVPGVDDGEEFVSDLIAIRRPAGNAWRYEVDGVGRSADQDEGAYCAALRSAREARTQPDDSDTGGIKGHQTAQIDPLGVRAQTSYGAHGLISSEVMDPGGLNLKTSYDSYDESGLPELVIDPEGFDNDEGGGTGEQANHRWLYDYDVVGNVTTAVDPRGSTGFGPTNMPGERGKFTTTLEYDSLDQLTVERTPKDTDRPEAEREFIERSYDYDLNGNQTLAEDGEHHSTVTDYTAMDRPKLSTDAEGSKVAYEYDQEQNLIRMVAPKGVATDVEGDYTTRFHLDEAGRRIATEQLSTQEDDLLTSYDLDERGNVVGAALPRNNSTYDAQTKKWTTVSLSQALTNAQGADRRYEMTYSDTDNLLAQVEDPGASPEHLNLRTEYVYDRNDNQVQVTQPRGFSEGDPVDFTTLTTYDARDQVTDTIDPLGGHSRYVRRADGLVTEQISPRGMETSTDGDFTTSYDYDANGNLTSRSIPYASGQYRLDDSELAEWKVTYERNEVGDPIRITDANGNVADYRCGPDVAGDPDECADMAYWRQEEEHTFTNTFYDTGDLASTERPSWWQLDWSSPYAETPDPGRRYQQTDSGLTPDFAVPQGGPALGEAPGPAAGGAEMAGMAPGPEDLPSGPTDFGSVDAEPLPDFLPRAGRASLAYDDEMRLKQVEDAAETTRGLSYDKVGRITEKRWSYWPGGADDLDDPAAESDADRAKPITHAYTYDLDGNLASYTDGEGTRAPQAAATYRWSFDYDQFDRRVSELAPGSLAGSNDASLIERDRTEFGYDPNGNLSERLLPRIYKGNNLAFTYGYDEADRLISETNPMGQSFTYGYDASGNTTSETSPQGTRTEISYDPLGRQVEVTEAVGSQWEDAALARTTTMAYDADGNLIEAVAPGSIAKASFPPQVQQDRATETTYDGRGLPWATTQAAGTEAARTVVQEFDPNGNLRRTVNPKGLFGGLPPTDRDYAAGLPTPKQVENLTPEERDNYEEQAKRAQDAASAASVHATVGVFDPRDQMVSLHMPWADEDPTTAIANGAATVPSGVELDQAEQNARRFRQDFSYDRRGRMRTVSSPYEWRDPGADVIDATTYSYYDTDWIMSQSDPKFTEEKTGPDGTSKLETIKSRAVEYAYDRRGIQTLWLTDTYSDPSADGDERRIVRTINPSGLLGSRVGKKQSPVPGEDPDVRRYDYYYNPSGSLVETFDRLPAEAVEGTDLQRDRTMIIGRDPAERQLRVNESWRGGRDTVFTYDADGMTTSRLTDGRLKMAGSGADCPAGQTASCVYEGGKTTTFSYDALHQERRMTVTERKIASDADPSIRESVTDYYPSGDPMSKERWTAGQPHVTETYFWRADGQMGQMQINRPGTDVEGAAADKNEVYAYDLNGNRTADERGTHAFNARDQLVLWKRGAEQEATPGSYVAYELNGSGAIQAQYDTGDTQPDSTTYDYFGDSSRIETVTTDDPSSPSDSRSYYRYDDFGNVTAIQTETRQGTAAFPGADTASGDPCKSWTESDTVYYCYDQFERLTATRTSVPQGSTKSPERNDYVYDGLDRRDFSITHEEGQGGTTKTREHYYVGMSELLSREETEEGRDTYDYDSRGSSQGQASTEDGTTTYHGYGKDANGSIETVEGENGQVAEENDRYVYDPYGALEDSNSEDAISPEDQLGDAAEANPFRFEGFYYDSGVESYDMQAREYRPDIGRFLSQDRFAAAAGDMQLQSDPLTQDRYAFAGGNPVSNVEFDGHHSRRQKRIHRQMLREYSHDTADGIRDSPSYSGWSSRSKRKLRRLEQNLPETRGKIFRIAEETGEQDAGLQQQALAEQVARTEAAAEADHGPISTAIHTGLAIPGFVPGLGEPFDALDGVIYAAQGDETGAGLSFASMVPAGGQGPASIRIARLGEGALNSSDEVAAVVKSSDEALGAGKAAREQFSVSNWDGYPGGIPKPTGELRLLRGAEYDQARAAANRANAALRRADPEAYRGKQIHEIQPVKFGGSPTDPANKIAVAPPEHYRLNAFWMRQQRYAEGGP